MFLSFAFYGGLVLLAGAALLLIFRKRRLAPQAALAGLAAIAIAVSWPAAESRTHVRETRLDEFMPAWQFNEVHTTHVNAPPERVYAATHAVTADEILLFQTLVAIRRFGRKTRESIVRPPGDAPLLDVATRTTFSYVADERPREIVVKTRIAPGVIAAMNFLITNDGGGGSNITTETRVFADSAAGKRRFAIYWRIIHPGSDIIRRMWLRAIKRRAEGVVG